MDVHAFAYIPRTGLASMLDRVADMVCSRGRPRPFPLPDPTPPACPTPVSRCLVAQVLDFGLLIEGHSDEELPERMLGCVRLSKMDLQDTSAIPELELPPL
jgi:hypothetical protein